MTLGDITEDREQWRELVALAAVTAEQLNDEDLTSRDFQVYADVKILPLLVAVPKPGSG